MYDLTDEQYRRQLEVLRKLRERATRDPSFARKFLENAGLANWPTIEEVLAEIESYGTGVNAPQTL